VKLDVKEVAELAKISPRHLCRLILSGCISAEKDDRGKYLIPVETLPEDLKAAYYNSCSKSTCLKVSRPAPIFENKSLEEMSYEERREYAFWQKTIKNWESFRLAYTGSKDEADQAFIDSLRSPEYQISRAILYRKKKLLEAGNPYAVVDHRGGHNKGVSAIPEEAWDWFFATYLDQRRLSVTQVYTAVQAWCRTFHPELASSIPSECAFRRRIKQQPIALITLGRYGLKACSDLHMPYIQRLYDDLQPNDYWIGDNHTLDIISKVDDGGETTHRLYLTAFIDARSGVMTGWYVTENPSSQSTIYALRHAIMRFGIPKHIYLDNGSEFLTHDLAGRGHRTKKSSENQIEPPTIFARLGIEMTNAIVRNAKAKPIERTFLAFKGQISQLFETFTGGNTQERPEILKDVLKKGRIPLDAQLRTMLDDLIDGVYNAGLYGGAIQKDRKKTRLAVWNEYIQEQRLAPEEDLNLMLLRTSKPQKISRNGVYLNIAGEKLFYWTDDSWKLQGQLVYVRFDPQCLDSIRVYDAETDRFIASWPMAKETRLRFAADVEEVSIGMQRIRGVGKDIRRHLKAVKEAVPQATHIDILDLQLRQSHAAREGMVITSPKKIVPISSGEDMTPYAMVAGDVKTIDISYERMNRNAAARTGKDLQGYQPGLSGKK